MNRRDLLRTAGLAGAAALTGSAQPRRPNVLFLFADDMRFDVLGAMGHPDVKTPNLDRLARRGTMLTHACIMGGMGPAICMPSRAMLLTGQSLFHVNDSIVQPQEAPPERKRPFHLFPEEFRKAGYATFGTGKWHNPPTLYARCFSQGATVFFGGMSDQFRIPVHDYDPSGRYPKENAKVGARHSTEIISDSAVGFLKARKEGDAPFLAYVSYTSPHDPRTPPPEYLAMYPPSRVTLPPNLLPEHPFDNGDMKVRDEQLAPWPRTPETVREHIAAYYGMITHLDAQIGRVLAALEETGEADNTVVVFAGDNGLAVGQHGLLGKQNLYDHSARVPLLMSGPGIPKGQRRDGMCYLLDVAPTLYELAGLPTPKTVEGQSLVPMLNGRKGGRDSVLLAYRNVQRGVRTDRWKLLLYNVKGRETVQLFDLQADPWERRNLAGEASQASRVTELRGLLREWGRKTDDPVDVGKAGWGVVTG